MVASDFRIGDEIEFDYTCEDNTHRHREGTVESVGADFIRLRFESEGGACIRTCKVERIKNLKYLKSGELYPTPAGWEHI